MKTFSNTDGKTLKENVEDVKIHGDPNLWKVVCKASSESEGWMKSTKAMQLPDGILVQVTTQQRNVDLSYSVAEALTYVPGAVLSTDMATDVTCIA